ncbi:MAG: hypothetical protein ACYCOR_13195 [Acidobacteriaceae bacterium]
MYREWMLDTRLVDNYNCPLCDQSAWYNEEPRTGNLLIVCRICGKFRISEEASTFLHNLNGNISQQRYKLMCVMRTRSERAFGKKDNSFFPVYSPDDLQKMLDQSDDPVQEKLNALLRYLGTLSEYPGHVAEFDSSNDYAVIGGKNYQEANFYLKTLADQKLVSLEASYTGQSVPRFALSATGWIELDRIARAGADSSSAFVAMSFDPSRSSFEEAINQGVEDAGYIPIRIDRVPHLNRIDDEIIARIRQSKFLIADFSGQRNGVYFEAGFMLGLGRPVIWACEKAELDKVHFDTRQYNTIDYTDANDLKSRLQVRIEANLGRGPHQKSGTR